MVLQVKDLSTFSVQAPKFCLVNSSQAARQCQIDFLFVSVNPRKKHMKIMISQLRRILDILL